MQTSTFLHVTCTACEARYRVALAAAGKNMKCKHCGEIFAVPTVDALAPAPRPAEVEDPPPERHPPHVPEKLHSGQSLRARHDMARPGFRITPMHILFAVATVVVIYLYIRFQH